MRTFASDGPDARDHLQHGLHRLRLGHQLRQAFAAKQRVLRFEALALPERLTELDLGTDDREQPRVVPRLLNEVAGAAAHGLDRHFHAAPRRHHHHRQRRIDALAARQQVEPLLAGGRVARVVEIDQGHVELARLDGRQHARGRRRRLELEALGLQQQAQRFEHVRLIVRDEHARLARANRVADGVRGVAALVAKVVGDQHGLSASSYRASCPLPASPGRTALGAGSWAAGSWLLQCETSKPLSSSSFSPRCLLPSSSTTRPSNR